MTILAIDPGPEKSAWVVYDAEQSTILLKDISENEMLVHNLSAGHFDLRVEIMVLERVACMGMAVGETVFETVFWSGRFAQAWAKNFHRITRAQVKMHLCGSMRAKDANIRQALIDKLGAPGTKRNQGKTYGISKDLWAALAVAVTFAETQQKQG